MLIAGIEDKIIKLVNDGLRALGALLCQLIYWLVANLYDLFLNVSSVQFLKESSLKPIYQRLTLILSIVMLFYVTFQTVKYVIQPDTFSDKEQGAGKVVTKMILVVLLIAMVPQIFSMAYKFQNSILKNQIFSKIILGKQDADISTYGRSFSANMFSLFYYVDEDFWGKSKAEKLECDGPLCETVVQMNITTLKTNGNLPYLSVGIKETGEFEDPSGETRKVYGIRFEWLLAVVVGIFICYMLILYCIDAGTRVAQLAFLQIIAPIPIIGYLSPKKDGIFEKWVKQCTTTYIDLFLRMGIIYTILLLSEILYNSYKDGTLLNGLSGVSSEMKFFVYVALVVGLLAFAKKAPKMLQELFPKMGAASGSLGLSWKDRTSGVTDLYQGAKKFGQGAAKVTGAGRRVVGGAAGFVFGMIGGRSFGAGVAGAKKGADKNTKGLWKGSSFKRIANAAHAGAHVRQVRKDIKSEGGTPWGSEHRQEHFKNVAQAQDRKVTQLEKGGKNKDAIRGAADEYKAVKSLKAVWESAKQGGKSQAEIDAAYVNYKNARDAAIKANAGGAARATKPEYDAQGNHIRGTGIEYKDANGQVQYLSIGDDEVDSFSRRIHDNMETSRAGLKGTALGAMTISVQSLDAQGNPILDPQGNPVIVQKKVEDLTAEEYAANIGAIADLADTEANNIKISKDYKEAHTNAKGSENSDKK